MDEIQKAANYEILGGGFELYLKESGLPYEGIIASSKERIKMKNSLPMILDELSAETKKNANYLSKFVASAAIGLYDASLNYLWNEVILSLRKSIIEYGIDAFFDAAVGNDVREQFQDESHLELIKDKVLLDTIKKLEIINNHLYMELTHILYRRNFIGASHPNEEEITSMQLLEMLETCVNKVIESNPSEGALYNSKFLKNIKKTDLIVTDLDISHFKGEIEKQSTLIISNLLRSLFSIYIDLKTTENVRSNILKYAPLLWKLSRDDEKFNIGHKIGNFQLYHETEKLLLSEKFLEVCDGMNYKSEGQRTNEINDLIERLKNAHCSFDNFYAELPIAKKISSYIKSNDDILPSFETSLIETITKCRIGNGYGVCNSAVKYYDKILQLLDGRQIRISIDYLENIEIRSLFRISNSRINLKSTLELFKKDTNFDRLNELIDYIINHIDIEQDRLFDTIDYKRITKSYIDKDK